MEINSEWEKVKSKLAMDLIFSDFKMKKPLLDFINNSILVKIKQQNNATDYILEYQNKDYIFTFQSDEKENRILGSVSFNVLEKLGDDCWQLEKYLISIDQKAHDENYFINI